jgi:hypothetical protein
MNAPYTSSYEVQWYEVGICRKEFGDEAEARALIAQLLNQRICGQVSMIQWYHTRNLQGAFPEIRSNSCALTTFTPEGETPPHRLTQTLPGNVLRRAGLPKHHPLGEPRQQGALSRVKIARTLGAEGCVPFTKLQGRIPAQSEPVELALTTQAPIGMRTAAQLTGPRQPRRSTHPNRSRATELQRRPST